METTKKTNRNQIAEISKTSQSATTKAELISKPALINSSISESLIIYLVVTIALLVCSKIRIINETGLATATILLWVPAILILIHRTNTEICGISRPLFKNMAYGIIVTIPFLFIYSLYIFSIKIDGGSFSHWFNKLFIFTRKSYGLLFYQFIIETAAVSIPEEFFFRGYIQGTFSRYFQMKQNKDWKKKNEVNKEWPKNFLIPIISSALLFAILHVIVSFDPARIIVFFPALLFGWFRYKTNDISASVICHSLCNIFHYICTGLT